MALAYGASNFHSANATEFAKNVSDKSGGKLSIVTHPGGSLYKGGEIFRAVRTGQAQIGERFNKIQEDLHNEVERTNLIIKELTDKIRELEKNSNIDPLTKVFNRRALTTYLNNLCFKSKNPGVFTAATLR